MKKRITFIVSFVLFVSICGLTAKAQAVGVDDACFIMPVELADKLNNKESLLLIDCRNKISFSEMHIESAINVPVSKIKSVGNDYEKYKAIIVYCDDAGCSQSQQAFRKLVSMGYKNTKILKSGIKGWESAGYNVICGKPAPTSTEIKIDNMPVDTFKKLIAKGYKFTVLDCRTESEFKAGHLAGAVNIPLDVLDEGYVKLPKDYPVVCCCKTGKRSIAAAKILISKGFNNVTNLSGGLAVWVSKKYPVVTKD